MQRKEKELLEAAMQSQEDVEKEMQVPSLLSLLAVLVQKYLLYWYKRATKVLRWGGRSGHPAGESKARGGREVLAADAGDGDAGDGETFS